MKAPKPINFDALSSAWDDPIRFAAELANYYQQLNADGYPMPRTFTKEDT